jgi:hypothetical protein
MSRTKTPGPFTRFLNQSKMIAAFTAVVMVVLARTTMAIPSPQEHVHNSKTVHWGAQDGKDKHNHLTKDPFYVADKWDINKAWDNRTLNSSGHGMILPNSPVRYGWGASIPNSAKGVVESSYNAWIAAATTQFDAKKDPWDRLAIQFDRKDTGDKDITISFVEGLQEGPYKAYGVFLSASKQIQFEATPTFELKTTGNGKERIRLGDTGVSGTEITVPLSGIFPATGGWSFGGTATSAPVDFDYSTDGGVTWTDAPPDGFGKLDWAGASFGHLINSGDSLNIFPMDFGTIALHEIGHSIALGHIGADDTAIMRIDIADFSLFGRTMSLDNDSALAVAIDYTYAVPEPGTLSLLLLGGLMAAGIYRLRERNEGAGNCTVANFSAKALLAGRTRPCSFFRSAAST